MKNFTIKYIVQRQILPDRVPLLPEFRNLPEQEKWIISSISGLNFWSGLTKDHWYFNSNQKLRRH